MQLKLASLQEKTYPVSVPKTSHFNWNFLPRLFELVRHLHVSCICSKGNSDKLCVYSCQWFGKYCLIFLNGLG